MATPVFCRRPFLTLTVLQGGTGAGTVIRFALKLAGTEARDRGARGGTGAGPRALRGLSGKERRDSLHRRSRRGSEPCPDRDLLGIEPWAPGLIERLVPPRLFRKLYTEELDLIERWAIEQSASRRGSG